MDETDGSLLRRARRWCPAAFQIQTLGLVISGSATDGLLVLGIVALLICRYKNECGCVRLSLAGDFILVGTKVVCLLLSVSGRETSTSQLRRVSTLN